jgi:hypothetical protein
LALRADKIANSVTFDNFDSITLKNDVSRRRPSQYQSLLEISTGNEYNRSEAPIVNILSIGSL